jgi:tRNA-modifying protein YgfZ
MSSGHIAYLNDRAVVRVSGADAATFLQGLITNEMALLETQGAIFAGLLSPQGKVLFEFLVVKATDGYLLDVARSAAGDLVKRLAMYKLRAKVEVKLDPEWRIVFGRPVDFIGSSSDPGKLVYRDPRLNAFGNRAMSLMQIGFDFELFDYHAHRIALGVPEGGKDYLFGDLFPHEAMFDQLNGVSFTKGCYVGQEIVARMQHRGTARSRFLMVAAAGPLPERGTEVLAGDRPVGQMGSSVGGNGLALIRLDRLGDAYKEGKPITTGGVPITLTKPPYAIFEVPTP